MDQKSVEEFLLWLHGLRTQHSLLEDASSIPGLAQCVKDPLLLQMWLGPSVAVAVSDLTPSLRTSICSRCDQKRKKEREKKEISGKVEDVLPWPVIV